MLNALKINIIISILFLSSQIAFSQTMDESRRGIQQSNDISNLIIENKICNNACMSNFKKEAYSNPSYASKILDQCSSSCIEKYQYKMACIQNQTSSKYAPSECNKSFENNSLGSGNASNFISEKSWAVIILLVLVVTAGKLFFNEKNISLGDNFLVKDESKNIDYPQKINVITSVFWLAMLFAIVFSYFKAEPHNASAFLVIPIVVFSGFVFTTWFQSIFFRVNPVFKIPESITHSASGFLISIISYFLSILIIFMYEVLFGSGAMDPDYIDPLILALLIFLINSLQISCFALLIKPAPDKYLYLGFSVIIVMIYNKFASEDGFFAIFVISAYIISVFSSKIPAVENALHRLDYFIGMRFLVKFLLKYFKFDKNFNSKSSNEANEVDDFNAFKTKEPVGDFSTKEGNYFSQKFLSNYLNLKKIIFFESGFYKRIINLKIKAKLLYVFIFAVLCSLFVYYSGQNFTSIKKDENVLKYLVNPSFEYIFDFNNGVAIAKNNGSIYFINNKGERIFDGKFSYHEMGFSDGLLAVAVKDGFSSDWGFINAKGEMIIQPVFASVKGFSDGFAAVLLDENGKWGFINKKGELILKPNYESPGYFFDGMANVDINEDGVNVNGFINKSGNFLIKLNNSRAYKYDENFAAVLNTENNKWGFINKQGSIIIEARFDSVNHFSEGLAAVEVDGKWGFINTTGKFVIEPKFIYKHLDRPEQDVYQFKGGMASVWMGDKMGFINKNGDVVIKSNFDEAKNFSEGLAAVRFGNEYTGKWGFINKNGDLVIAPIFDSANSFSEGFASVSSGGEYSSSDNFATVNMTKSSKWGIIYNPNNKSNQ